MVRRNLLFVVLSFVILVVWIIGLLGYLTQALGALAIVNAAGYFTVIYAFRASFRDLSSPTWWFATGFAILAGAIILRGLYWDFSLPLLRHYVPGAAEWWVDTVNGRMINVSFAIMKMMAFFCALKCREKMIPEDEQDKWPWWRAWMHPSSLRLLPWRW